MASSRVKSGKPLAASPTGWDLFESIPQPAWIYDTDTLRFLEVSRSAIRVYGYTRDEFLAMTLEDIRPPGDVALLRAHLNDVAQEMGRMEWTHRRKDGSTFTVQAAGEAVTYRGRPARLVVATDVTERVEAIEELGRQNELLKTLFDNIPAMIAVLNARGEILTVNHETERVTGYSADELRSEGDVAALLCFDSDAVDGAREFVQRADRTWGEFHLRAKDGTEITAAWANAKLSDGSLIGIGQDVTERKALEGQLRQAQKMESVGRLAGGIAHDFNNLLTAILGFSTLAYRDAPPDGTVRRALDEVRKAAERAASLTRQLLVFSRKQVVVSETVDLCEVVNDTVGMLRRMIGEDVRLHTDVMARDATVQVDRGQIEQVLLNLAVNSRDAMPQGGDLWLQVERFGGRVVLSVRDSGVGMDENVRSHIFEPFFTTKPLGEGTGLGLATVFGIVQQCGGSIEVDTAPGKGTTFRISIPWQSRHAPAALAEAPGIAASGGHEVVLLVEDEDAVRRLVAAVLEGSGYRVLVTASGEEAFRMASDPECAIDLVLSDLVMPGTNGREVVERLQVLRPGLRSLFMSGYTSDVIVRRGVQTGDSPFIQKPFLPATLLAKVRQVLDAASPDTVAGSH